MRLRNYKIVILLAAGIMMSPCTAMAQPVAGATLIQYEQMRRAPIARWQQDILEILNEPPTKEQKAYIYAGKGTLNRRRGVFYGPSGKESYYNLPMGRVVKNMRTLEYRYPYWVRQDGVKMLGDYVMVAADLKIRPKGTILNTSLGPAIVCDTGEFAKNDSTALDVAVDWS